MKEHKQFESLPEGYEIRRDRVLTSARTSRKMTLGGDEALYEIAAATPRWTEWGDGHATSMHSGSCERRGYIEVAVHKSKRLLFRATREGVLLANKWRKERGEEPLPLPDEPTLLALIESNVGAESQPLTREEVEEFIERRAGARGSEWPESLGTFELHDAILAEADRDRLEMLNAELRARLDMGTAVQRV